MAKTATDRKRATGRRAGAVEAAGADAASQMARLEPEMQRRVIVEGVHPEVDAGRFPIKRTEGEEVVVGADIFTDGHDTLGAALLHRRAGESEWTEVPMAALGRSEEHTSELQSRLHLVCRLLLEKK